MGDHVFVSYARPDETYVDKLAAHLRARGVQVWTDAAIYFGTEWPETIQEKIDSCAAFVVVMSPAARRSAWVRREVLRAQAQRKRIFPLLLSGEALFEVGDLQHEDVGGGDRLPSPRWVDDLRAAASRPADGRPSRDAPTGTAGVHGTRAAPQATLTGHTGGVTSVAFAPDERTLATGSYDGTVRLWEGDRQTLTLAGHTAPVGSVAFAPDGRTLATGGHDRTVRLWEPGSGGEIAILTGHTGWVRPVAFAPGGRTLATGSDDTTVRLWDLGTGRETATLTGHTHAVWSVAFAPGGGVLAAGGSDGTVRLWELGSTRPEG